MTKHKKHRRSSSTSLIGTTNKLMDFTLDMAKMNVAANVAISVSDLVSKTVKP